MHMGTTARVFPQISTVSTDLSTEIPRMSFRIRLRQMTVIHTIHTGYDDDEKYINHNRPLQRPVDVWTAHQP